MADAQAAHAALLSGDGRLDEAAAAAARALELDGDSFCANRISGRVAFLQRDFARAAKHFLAAADIVDADVVCYLLAAQCQEGLGDIDGMQSTARLGLVQVEKCIAEDAGNTKMLNGIVLLALLGEKDRCLEWAGRVMTLDPDGANTHYNLTCTLLPVQEVDSALDHFELACGQLTQAIFEWAQSDSDLDVIRGHPRFQAAMAGVKKILAGGNQSRQA